MGEGWEGEERTQGLRVGKVRGPLHKHDPLGNQEAVRAALALFHYREQEPGRLYTVK